MSYRVAFLQHIGPLFNRINERHMKSSRDKFYGLIVAGGQGSRFSSEIPKQYCVLGGISILRRSVEALLPIIPVERIKIVIHPDHQNLYERAINGLNLPPPAFCGNTRKDSVYNGLKSLSGVVYDDDIILIHDAARPLLHPEDLTALCDAFENNDAACLAVPASDTLCHAGEGAVIKESLPRDGLWALQTPQAFRYGTIFKAHNEAQNNQATYTDDTALAHAAGIPVKLVQAQHPNFKITRQEDFTMATHILSTRIEMETRTGMGFDVHAFADDAENITSVRLCGVDIPHHRALKGHSDADVGLHALTDAILGAIGEGDIGIHFPPSDMTFKNMDSAIFLEYATKLLNDKGGRIVNVDVTLICERPKIGPHRAAIQLRMAEILGIAPHRVNIKATTTEQLGFTGRSEGIAAQAIATILLPVIEGL